MTDKLDEIAEGDPESKEKTSKEDYTLGESIPEEHHWTFENGWEVGWGYYDEHRPEVAIFKDGKLVKTLYFDSPRYLKRKVVKEIEDMEREMDGYN